MRRATKRWKARGGRAGQAAAASTIGDTKAGPPAPWRGAAHSGDVHPARSRSPSPHPAVLAPSQRTSFRVPVVDSVLNMPPAARSSDMAKSSPLRQAVIEKCKSAGAARRVGDDSKAPGSPSHATLQQRGKGSSPDPSASSANASFAPDVSSEASGPTPLLGKKKKKKGKDGAKGRGKGRGKGGRHSPAPPPKPSGG